jgi:tetratricopeptide (TPR) repeat protein
MKGVKARTGYWADRACLLFLGCMVMALVLSSGCSQFQARSTLREADGLFSRGEYSDALRAYERIIQAHPREADRVLFEMGVIHSYPRNEHRDYQKALDCFKRIIRDFPDSSYRHESERMVFHIRNVTLKDARIAAQQEQIKALQREVESREKNIRALENERADCRRTSMPSAEDAPCGLGPADRILIEKRDRKLTLFSKDRIMKTYRWPSVETRRVRKCGRATTRHRRDLLH